jgi:hypothetical protein
MSRRGILAYLCTPKGAKSFSKYKTNFFYNELASTLGIPVGTVMSRLSRARRRLHQEFAGVRRTASQDGL